jgi:hypothetical protein
MKNLLAKNVIRTMLENGSRYTATELSDAAGLQESDSTAPKARKIILELIEDGFVIGSTAKGYKMLTSGKEIQQYLNALLKRQIGISNRIQAVYDAAQAKGLL